MSPIESVVTLCRKLQILNIFVQVYSFYSIDITNCHQYLIVRRRIKGLILCTSLHERSRDKNYVLQRIQFRQRRVFALI